MNTVQALQQLLDAAIRFEARTARHTRLDAEQRVLQEAITDAQLILSVGNKNRPTQANKKEREASSDAVMEAGALLRSLPGGKGMRAEYGKTAQKKRPKSRLT